MYSDQGDQRLNSFFHVFSLRKVNVWISWFQKSDTDVRHCVFLSARILRLLSTH